jgi:hypothetical protein
MSGMGERMNWRVQPRLNSELQDYWITSQLIADLLRLAIKEYFNNFISEISF